jgi:hypothetical protein
VLGGYVRRELSRGRRITVLFNRAAKRSRPVGAKAVALEWPMVKSGQGAEGVPVARDSSGCGHVGCVERCHPAGDCRGSRGD